MVPVGFVGQDERRAGLLGAAQLAWLANAFDARPDKPALVLAHHNPGRFWDIHGLADTEALLRVLLPRKQVKTYFFGHLHRWHLDQQEGTHLVNLPTTAWLFEPAQPRGFVTAQLRPDGAAIVLARARSQAPEARGKDRFEMAGVNKLIAMRYL